MPISCLVYSSKPEDAGDMFLRNVGLLSRNYIPEDISSCHEIFLHIVQSRLHTVIYTYNIYIESPASDIVNRHSILPATLPIQGEKL
jgi:hypothetical protein